MWAIGTNRPKNLKNIILPTIFAITIILHSVLCKTNIWEVSGPVHNLKLRTARNLMSRGNEIP